jgi:hypothetical protein
MSKPSGLTITDRWQAMRHKKDFTDALTHLGQGNPEPVKQFASLHSCGDAWNALGDFYASHRPEEPALATDAYREAMQCKNWFEISPLPTKVRDKYDRRCFLGIGAAQDFPALAREWKSLHNSGDDREVQLAWIFTYGPAELRNLGEARCWIEVAPQIRTLR